MKNISIISSIDKRSMLFEAVSDGLIPVPDGMMRVSGVIAKMDVMNNNGRFYTKENYTKHIDSIQDKIATGLYGEMEHPDSFNINYNNVSHKVEKLWYDHATDEVKGIFLLLDNEKGKTAQAIVKSGGTLRCSTRCAGDVAKGNEARISKFYTVDLVGTPGFDEAKLFLMESLDFTSKSNSSDIKLLNEDDNSIVYVSELKQMLLESKKYVTNDSALLEALNERTNLVSSKESKKLYESIKSKILKR
ncbi:gp151 [Sphingomonas phage PAU]|uniref:gp151 n=1 Tax=Sphingomonas phage PAU TaxID=1150991 RepID=UPI00025732E3|nr:gp151 [Sphingomonas phage PAU]AFF28149.1 gp151 [Sphingomonas phage PAU]